MGDSKHSKNGDSPKRKQTRNKPETIQTFIAAATQIILTDGVKALRINRVERVSGKSKRMLYDYFGSIEGLLKATLENHDFWLAYEKKLATLLELHSDNQGKELAAMLLKSHLSNFIKDKIAQEVSLLELTDSDNELFRELCEDRERLGDKLFALSETYFANSPVNIRMICALLIGGVNYMVLHSKSTCCTFCGTDIRQDRDFKELYRTLEQITNWAYEHAKDREVG